MKGNNKDFKFNKHFFKNKIDKFEPNPNQYIKFNSNLIKNNNYYFTYINKKPTPRKENEESKKTINSINENQIYNYSSNSNNDLIQSYSKKPNYNISNDQLGNNSKEPNLSRYKQILNKMIDQYANCENSKENINNLLKKSISSQKYSIGHKAKVFSPTLKKRILDDNGEKIKQIYYTGDNRSIKRKNKLYIQKVIRLQAFWRGYFLRKIIVRGMKKYYGLIYIYKLLKKYKLKRKKNIFEIVLGRRLKNKNNKYLKFSPSKNNYVYSRKLFFNNNSMSLNHSEKKKSFSFSSFQIEQNKSGENIYNYKTKNFFSDEKKKDITSHSYNNYNYSQKKSNPQIFKNRLTNSVKEINNSPNNLNNMYFNQNNNNNYFELNKNLGSYILTSNIIKGDGKNSKIGKITSNFFNKYKEKESQPIDTSSESFFRKPIFKKRNQNKNYIYVHKNLNQKDEKSLSPRNIYSYNSSYGSNKNLYDGNKIKINKSLYNIYKFIFTKIINIIKKRTYNLYFQSFIYQLRIKRKIEQIKLYYATLLSIITKKEKKILKKYLSIYRENVLTLKAKEFLNNEKYNNKTADIKSVKRNNKPLQKYIKKTYNNKKNKNNNIYTINKNKEEMKYNKKDKNDIQNNNSNKKDILRKLIKIKNKCINKIVKKFFQNWIKNSKLIISNGTLTSSLNYSNNNNIYNTINHERRKITVNKRKIKIKKENNLSNSQNSERKATSLSKEKKMKIIRRVSEPKEYLLLYNSFNKNLKNSLNKLNSYDILKNEEKNVTLHKIFYIINKLECKKILYKFFIDWKKMKK